MINTANLLLVGAGILFVVLFGIGWVILYARLLKKYRKRLEEFNTLQFHKKSSEIRLGKIGENMAPFLKGWPWDPNKFHFIGYPTDGIQFNDDEVVFVEIKTGKSRLTPTQRKIRDIVKAKKVSFATFRIGENGIELKKGDSENGDV